MPAPGDQHRDTKASANPFEEPVRRINEYTAQQIATLQCKLDRQLGPEYISTRPGANGGKVHYITAEKVINLANEVFGFNGWSSSLQNIQVDFVDEAPGGKVSLGLSATVRITLRDGTFHEDIGYGHIENCKGKAAAFEKSKKEAVTDAMKRSLRNFGNLLGNCLYDKDFLQKVTKVKATSTKFDPDNLHRHPDYCPPVKKEQVAEPPRPIPVDLKPPPLLARSETSESFGVADDEFGDSDGLFNEMEFTHISHTDEVCLDTSMTDHEPETSIKQQPQPQHQRPQPNGNITQPSANANPNTATRAPTTPQPHTTTHAQRNGAQGQGAARNSMPPPAAPNLRQVPSAQAAQHAAPRAGSVANGIAANSTQVPQVGSVTAIEELPSIVPVELPEGVPSGFVSGGMALKPGATAFNPHADSPSIRRTSLVNAGKSAPIKRSDIVAATGAAPPDTATTSPALDATRKIGMPATNRQGPMGNRGAFKPLAVKRPAPAGVGASMDTGAGPAVDARQPLSDMSNGQLHTNGPSEAKKQRLDPGKAPAQTGQAEIVNT